MFPHPKPKIHSRPVTKPVPYHQTHSIHNHQIVHPKPKKK